MKKAKWHASANWGKKGQKLEFGIGRFKVNVSSISLK